MRSRKILALTTALMFCVSGVIAGCSASPDSEVAAKTVKPETSPVTVRVEGERAENFVSLDQLAQKSSAIVHVEPTGNTKSVPLSAIDGADGSAPIEYIELAVANIIDGAVEGEAIWVVSPGVEDETARPALTSPRSYILFLAPAMYAANEPIGGYVVVGGPAGMFVEGTNARTTFFKVDPLSEDLPNTIDSATTDFPKITKTEEELLHEGP
ncbi:hypothetical protein [Timonella sp. A28]|uniref:hypothetical protein n=1 Tax=Timonella sp. A28 TaxID=3442640 RepID=UPI003EBC1F8E